MGKLIITENERIFINKLYGILKENVSTKVGSENITFTVKGGLIVDDKGNKGCVKIDPIIGNPFPLGLVSMSPNGQGGINILPSGKNQEVQTLNKPEFQKMAAQWKKGSNYVYSEWGNDVIVGRSLVSWCKSMWAKK